MQTVLLRVVGSDTKLGQLLTKVLIKIDIKLKIRTFWTSRSDTIIFLFYAFHILLENFFDKMKKVANQGLKN